MLRDCSERGRTVDGVLFQYNRFVKKSYDEYIKPTMKYANIIVPFGSDNTTAIDFIVQNLKSKLEEHSLSKAKPNKWRDQLNDILKKEESFMKSTEEEIVKTQKTLGFEIVDYAIDYIGFKKNVSYFEAGNLLNFKLEIMLKNVIDY